MCFAAEQARFQIAALVVTLIMSIGGGVITGMVIKFKFFVYEGVKKVGRRDVLIYLFIF